jgi:hypothetical protein
MLGHQNRRRVGNTVVDSVWDPFAREKAAELIAQGKPVGIFNRGVCAIWGDAQNEDFIESVALIKGEERRGRPLGASLPSDKMVSYINFDLISQDLRSLFLDATELSQRLGSLCFIRIPITEEAAGKLPSSLVSRDNGIPILQNWDPYGHFPTADLIRRVMSKGVDFPGCTSMNPSGVPEFVDQKEGEKFSAEKDIPMFLEDPSDPGITKGSYSIISVGNDGAKLIRDGNVPGNVINKVLGSLDMTNASLAKHPQPNIPEGILAHENPRLVRAAIIFYLQGKNGEDIQRVIRRYNKTKG